MKHIRTTAIFVVLAMLATMATAHSTHRQKPKKGRARPAAVKVVTAPEPAGARIMAGTWTLRDGDKPRKDVRIIFRANGTFAFVGPNWESAGTYKVQNHTLSLEWSSVDRSKVTPGTVKRDVAIADDEVSFTIDKYTYFKL